MEANCTVTFPSLWSPAARLSLRWQKPAMPQILASHAVKLTTRSRGRQPALPACPLPSYLFISRLPPVAVCCNATIYSITHREAHDSLQWKQAAMPQIPASLTVKLSTASSGSKLHRNVSFTMLHCSSLFPPVAETCKTPNSSISRGEAHHSIQG